MYQLFRKIFFLFDPEVVHRFAMNYLRILAKIPFGKNVLTSFLTPKDKVLKVKFLNMNFRNPVGLGAGFDKNAAYLNELEALGFGFVEIGTVTPLPQIGNEKPRLFRLPKDKALINRMGFNNEGADVIAERLKNWRDKEGRQHKNLPMIIGGNIGKNKVTPNEDAWNDYAVCFNKLHPFVDYFAVNVSSPNTPGLRALQEKDSLKKILLNLAIMNNGKAVAKPVLLKIAPDLTAAQLDDVIDLALEIKLDGIIISNTTISREGLSTSAEELEKIGAGGLSGKPIREKSTAIIKYIFEKTKGQVPIVASGGIFNAEDAREKLRAGASLVQVWTGFIYEGPAIVSKICKKLNQ